VPDSNTISFVSYFSFVSKGLESQRILDSYLVALKDYDSKVCEKYIRAKRVGDPAHNNLHSQELDASRMHGIGEARRFVDPGRDYPAVTSASMAALASESGRQRPEGDGSAGGASRFVSLGNSGSRIRCASPAVARTHLFKHFCLSESIIQRIVVAGNRWLEFRLDSA
jgi:hypothetical protein